MTVSANDAHPFCIYAGRFRVTFPVFDADGDLVTAMTTPDSERSIDQGTYADCTNEATEIATSSGTYYLDLTATETTGKNVSVIVKSATAGMKTTFLSIPIVRMPILRSGTAQAGAASTITLDSGASANDDFYNGLWIQCSNNSPANVQGQTRRITDYVGSTKVATVEAAWGTNPSNATTFDILVPEVANVAAWLTKEPADPATNGVPKVNTTHLSGTAQTARDIGASVLLSAGTGTGQLDFTSGVVKSNVTQYGGSAGTFAAGRPEVNTTHFGGTAATTAAGLPEVNTTHIAGSAVSTSSAQIGVNVVNAGGTAWGSGAITAGSIAAAALNGKGDWNIGKTGYALSAAGVQAIWDALTSALTTVGSIGKLLVDNINATISSRLASASYTAPLDAAGTRSAVGLASANLDTQLAAVQADTDDIQTRLPAALVSGRMNASVGAMAADTLTAAAMAADAGTEIAAAVLGATLTESYAADGAAPTLQQALLMIQQFQAEKSIAGVTLTVKKLDGTTAAATFTLDSATAPTSITRAT